MRLKDQVAYVTGGASGLGKAIIERFIQEGAKVVALDRSVARLAELEAAHQGSFIGVEGDVRSYASHKEAVDIAASVFGKIDCVIPNAALWDFSVSLDDLPEAQMEDAFDEMFHVNVLGYMFAVKAALPSLVASKGSVTFTISTSGFYAAGGGPLYVASKHAVVGLVRQLAYELAPHVRVNGIAPGGIGGSDIRGPASMNLQDTSFRSIPVDKILADVLPMGEMASAEEYAGAYVFLSSRQDHVPATNAIINMDGGMGVRGLTQPAGGKDLATKYAGSAG